MNNNTKEKEQFAAELWIQWEQIIRNWCKKKLPDHPEDVDDIISETFLALCLALDKDIELKSPVFWLFGTASHFTSKKIKEYKLIREKYSNNKSLEKKSVHNTDLLDDIISENDILKMKVEIESELKAKEKILYRYAYIERKSNKEIAELMNITESAAKQRRYRLSLKIKSLVKDKNGNFFK